MDQPVRILVTGSSGHLGEALMRVLRGRGHEVTGVDVGSDASTITLRAPTVRVATRFIVVASFTDGFGQESIVQPLTVRP